MSDPTPVIDDLCEESEEVDRLVAGLSPEQWALPTPAAGWTVAHQIAHLAWTDRSSLLAVTDQGAFAREAEKALTEPGDFVDNAAREGADAELAAARAEAASAFGDGEVFVEPHVQDGRHVEVQVLADTHGTVWTLDTRDCSLQRRHQKVIEEAPAPGLSARLTGELHTLAVRAARAVSHVGAGTVEFLVADGRAHFLEMSTRLQVEHPVTEAVFGVDLVAEQIRVAEGHPLEKDPPRASGHAVEARLYAEEPAHDWAPQTGRLHRLAVPDGIRLDTGYTDGDDIGVHYDPLIAKVVAHAPTRAEAIRKLAFALDRAVIHGPVTNRDLLVRSLRHEEFAGARVDTASTTATCPG